MLKLFEPTLLIDESKVEYNIQSLVHKINDIHFFRPHFKTHQSRSIGQIFRRKGINKICVSSMKMAEYFHADGWSDITIAFPFNIHQIDALNQLAQTCRVQVVVESMKTIQFLQRKLNAAVEILIKIDVGYGRAGVNYTEIQKVLEMAKCSNRLKLNFFRFIGTFWEYIWIEFITGGIIYLSDFTKSVNTSKESY